MIHQASETDTLYIDDNIDNERNYWYKMSAYKIVEDKKLEGYRSEPKSWN